MKFFKFFLVITICIAPMALTSSIGFAQTPLKIFISIDMEGLTGVVNSDDCRTSGKDYDYFREIMANELNAAMKGAFEAGATEIVVRDSHGAKKNLIPGDLLSDPRVKLLRGVSQGPKNMMEYIDETFDAVMFIGYHAKAGTPNAILEHTSTGNVIDFSINGVSLPEAGYNALIAGLYDVPAIFVSGDKAVCDQLTDFFGDIETVAVKEEKNDAVLGMHPDVALKLITQGTKRALSRLSDFKPYKLQPPYKMVLKVKIERPIFEGSAKISEGVFTFESNDLLKVLDAFNKMK